MEKSIELNVQQRSREISIPDGIRKIKLEVSRDKCQDVLLELVDKDGKARGKPLNKYLPEIKLKNEVRLLRFIMNDFSTRPITITISTQ